jgi:hypothetical protein
MSEPRAVAGPAISTPLRRPGSVRRTTTHDSIRRDGILGPVDVVARGRDLHTAGDGVPTVLAVARLDLRVAFPDREVLLVSGDPSHPGLQSLVGRRASAGFRKAIDEAMPGERSSRSVRFQLLDDLPTALLVSGYAVQAVRVPMAGLVQKGPKLQHPDLCAGWAVGGTLLSGLDDTGRPSSVRTGPVAPSLDAADDLSAWHETDPLPPHGMRRRRRLDVWEDRSLALVECFFRDSHMSAEGIERVVHEYTVHATVDPSTLRILTCHADVGALPYPECPNAAASATRLGGEPVEGLRRLVSDTFVGPSTCTHLNDTLRSLEDVGGLLTRLRQTAEP